MPTVSVVIPTYNRPHLLERAIKSVLQQTYDDYECIVVDDGSTEDIEASVEKFADSRLTYVAHEQNRGGNVARNTGIDAAAGEYVAFLDSDDVWHPEKLAQQVTCLESRSSDWVGVYCLYRTTSDRRGERLRRFVDRILPDGPHATEGPEGGRELIDDLLLDNVPFGGTSTLMIRTDTLESIDGFDESFSRNQDRELLMRLLQTGKLACVDEELVVRYDTDLPTADSIREANEQFAEKFADEIARVEADGHDVMSPYDLFLAKAYVREGRFLEAALALPDGRLPIRHYVMMLNYGARYFHEQLTGTVNDAIHTHSGKRQ